MSIELSPRMKLAAARLYAGEKMPYFRAGLHALIVHEVPRGTLGTLGVTRHAQLLVDPVFVERLSVEELGGVLLHELLHVIRDHAGRREAKAADPRLWNIAADCEINDDLEAARVRMPTMKSGAKGVYPKTFGLPNGNIAEWYYDQLRQQQEKTAKALEQILKELEENGPQGGAGHCGSGAGNPVPGEPDPGGKNAQNGDQPDPSKGGGNADGDAPEGRSEAELGAVRRQVAEAVREAAAKGRGDVPGGIGRWADGFLEPPKVDWREKLARLSRAAVSARHGSAKYRYDRPSRRQGAFGYGPGKPIMSVRRHQIPRVAIAIDTSGSMGSNELSDACREAKGVLAAVGAEVTFISVDCTIGSVTQVKTVQELAKSLVGGGGTDFAPAFEAISKLKDQPNVLVYITDGGGPTPVVPPPGLHTIWVLVGAHRCTPMWRGAPFGDIIEVDS